jgi:hypothetical protein
MNYPNADLAYWQKVQRFTLTEAAWLWCGIEPPARGLECMPLIGKGFQPPHPLIPGLPARGDTIARALWRDIKASKLFITTDHPDRPYYLIPRSDLHAWAEQHGDKPPFLFPPVTHEKPKRRITERQHEHAQWKTCADTIQQERAQAGLRKLNKVGLASEVIDRLDLRDSVETVRKKI